MLSLRVCALILSFTSSLTLAAPVSDGTSGPVVRRGDGTQGSPKTGIFRIEGWEDLAEINCYIMLCIIGSSVFQRGPIEAGWGEDQFVEGGGKNEPFHDQELKKYGTSRASDSNVSPEDFPWRSIRIQSGEHRYLTGGPEAQQRSQAGCITNGYNGHYGGDIIGANEWFEIQIRAEDADKMGEMCKAWHADDKSVCGDNKSFNILGAVGVVLAQLVYYYVRSEGRYYHASQKGSKRDLRSVQLNVDSDDLAWPDIPADAEEVKRAVVVLDEAGNELARSEKWAEVELDERGNELARSHKRAVVELDESGNELSSSDKRGVVELDASGNELSSSDKREIVELDASGNELSSSDKRGVVELDASGNEISSSSKRGVVELDEAGNEISGSK